MSTAPTAANMTRTPATSPKRAAGEAKTRDKESLRLLAPPGAVQSLERDRGVAQRRTALTDGCGEALRQQPERRTTERTGGVRRQRSCASDDRQRPADRGHRSAEPDRAPGEQQAGDDGHRYLAD